MGAGSNNRDKVVNAKKYQKIPEKYQQHYNNNYNNRHLCIYVNVFLCVYVLFLSAVSLFSPFLSLFLFLSFSVLAVSLCVYLLSVYDIFCNYNSLSKFMASNL